MNNIYKKPLVIGIILLFAGVSLSSAISIDNKPVISQDESEENNNFITTNNYLERRHLPLLILSLHHYRKSNDRNVEIERIVDNIINQIRVRGRVTDIDVQNILIDNNMKFYDVYTNCEIVGNAYGGQGFTFPPGLIFAYIFAFITALLTGYFYFIGIGGLLRWRAYYPTFDYPDINIGVGSKSYTGEHVGLAFGFYGSVRIFPGTPHHEHSLDINGHTLIAFIRNPIFE